MVGVMDRLDVHERIIQTEYEWYGEVRDVPKVYDADARRHTNPGLRKGDLKPTAIPLPPGDVVLEITVEEQEAFRAWLASVR